MKKKVSIILLMMALLITAVSPVYAEGLLTETKEKATEKMSEIKTTISEQVKKVVAIFSDIKNHWGEETINWALVKGIVTGYVDGTFRPNNHVTESEFLALLIRAYHPEILVNDKGHWAENYYKYAKEMNYTLKGMNDLVARNQVIDRGYVAELIAATQGYNYTGDDAIKFLLGNGLAKGTDPNKVTIKSYNKEGKLSRAEAVQFIRNVVDNGTEDLQTKPKQLSDTSTLPDIPTGNNVYGNVEFIGNGGSPFPPSKKDDIARETAIKFVESITLKDKKIHLEIPNIPKGYNLRFSYNDTSGLNGQRDFTRDYDVLVAKTGDKHVIPFYEGGGYLVMSISINDSWGVKPVEFIRIEIPTMKMTSEYEGW